MITECSLRSVIFELLYSRWASIDIVLPYYNMKKQVGPKLARLLKDAGIPRIKATTVEWVVLTDIGPKRINFTTSISRRSKSLIIIPDDREEKNV